MILSFIIPALKNTGPILVVRDIIGHLVQQYPDDQITVFYLDQVEDPIAVDCSAFWLKAAGSESLLLESDIIHSHGIRPDYYVFKNRKKIKGKCVSTIHSLLFNEYRFKYNRLVAYLIQFIWSRLVSRHDKIVALTAIMKQHYTHLVPEAKLIVINNGRNVTTQDIDPNDRGIFAELKEKYRIIGIACVLNKGKGLHQVVEILPQLPDFAFVIIGDGPERSILEDQAARLGLGDRCLFLGTRSEGYRYNRYFDYYVFPSYTEGLPLSLLEAAALSKVVICSSIPVHHEIFTDQEVSFFRLDDHESLIQAIHDAQLKGRDFQANIFKKYNERYTAQIMAQSYYTLYSSLARS